MNIMRKYKNNRQQRTSRKIGTAAVQPIAFRQNQNKKQLYKLCNVKNTSKSKRLKQPLASSYFILQDVGLNKSNNNYNASLKAKFDQLVHEMFNKIDFDCSGFITFTKISYYKQLPESIFYFFGGVFQKVKQLGGISQKMFVSLCDEAFTLAKIQDLEEILNHPSKFKPKTVPLTQRNSNVKSKTSLHSERNKVESKYHMITDRSQHKYHNKSQFKTKSIQNGHKSLSKLSLKLQLQSLQRRNRLKESNKQKKKDQLQKQKNISQYIGRQQNFSFESSRVRHLTQRLDKQLQQSAYCLNSNRYIH